jgi:hypothetical protein
VVIRIHRVAVRGEGIEESLVPGGVLAAAVRELHHRAGIGLRGMDVVHDRDAVCIDELGHGDESMARERRRRSGLRRFT